jgi:hypothetical protein
MVDSISTNSRVSQQNYRSPEFEAADDRKKVEKPAERTREEAVAQKTAEPVREYQKTRAEEIKEKPEAESADALRKLASKEPDSPPPAPDNSGVNADAVIAAYKK